MQDSVSHAKKLKRKKDNRKLLSQSTLKNILIPVSIIISVALVDQLTKIWAVNNLSYHNPVEVIGSFLMFTLVYNEGGAMGTNLGSSTYYLIAASFILLFVLYYLYINRHNYYLSIPLSFIAGGAIGNLIDRVAYGKVVDFIDVDFFNIDIFGFTLDRWWTFNIADSAVLCSIIFLLYMIVFKKMPEDKLVTDKTENSLELKKKIEDDN
ncbi:MAG: signal peptidase II [Calditrichaeota bacterium]|nr:MAG: signal peptidase II [Calditrichota bacterium]